MELDLRGCFQIIWKRRRRIAVLLIAAALASYVGSRLMTPIYRASTKILIKQAGPASGLALFDELTGISRNQVQNYVEILKSNSLARSMAELMGLDPQQKDGPFARLKESIAVQPVQGTDAIAVHVESNDPREAAAAANALIRALGQRTQIENQADVRAARSFIENQVETVRNELSAAEDAVQNYQTRNAVVEPSHEATSLVNRLTALESSKAEAEVAIFEGEALLKEVQKQLSEREQTVVASQTLSENPVLAQYKKALAELQIQKSQALEKYSPGHPTVAAFDGQIADIQKKLTEQMARVVDTETVTLNPVRQALIQQALEAQSGVMAAQARRDGLEKLIVQSETRFAKLPSQQVELARLMRTRSVLESIYLMLTQKHEEFRISEEMKTADIQVIDPAEVPEAPVRPRTMLNVAVAVFLALFGGCGLAFLAEYLDTTIKTPEDVQEYLGLPVLGMIPSGRLERDLTRGHKARYCRAKGRRLEG